SYMSVAYDNLQPGGGWIADPTVGRPCVAEDRVRRMGAQHRMIARAPPKPRGARDLRKSRTCITRFALRARSRISRCNAMPARHELPWSRHKEILNAYFMLNTRHG